MHLWYWLHACSAPPRRWNKPSDVRHRRISESYGWPEVLPPRLDLRSRPGSSSLLACPRPWSRLRRCARLRGHFSIPGFADRKSPISRFYTSIFACCRCGSCQPLLLSHCHVFPFASILARISDFSTLPTLERGRSSQTSICLGVLTLPTRCFTKADTAATSTVRPALGCTTATTRSPHFSSGKPMTAQS